MYQMFSLVFMALYILVLASGSSDQFYNVSSKTWDQEFKRGKWSYLNTQTIERSRSMVVSTLSQLYGDSTRGLIIDVGCGEGVLVDFISEPQRKNYIGVDVSHVAINHARKRYPEVAFIQSSAEQYTPPRNASVIVFNEMLYYMHHRDVLRRFQQFLTPGGVIIISCWFNSKIDGIMSAIFHDAEFFYSLVDFVVLDGFTMPRNLKKKIPVAFKIGVFKVKESATVKS